MKYIILVLALFVVGCREVNLPQRVVVQRRVVQATPEAVDEMEALKKEYKENWEKEKESEEGWVKARKQQDALAIKVIEAKTAEESFEFARQLAEIGPIEKKLWKDWKDAVSRRYEIVERMAKLSK